MTTCVICRDEFESDNSIQVCPKCRKKYKPNEDTKTESYSLKDKFKGEFDGARGFSPEDIIRTIKKLPESFSKDENSGYGPAISLTGKVGPGSIFKAHGRTFIILLENEASEGSYLCLPLDMKDVEAIVVSIKQIRKIDNDFFND